MKQYSNVKQFVYIVNRKAAINKACRSRYCAFYYLTKVYARGADYFLFACGCLCFWFAYSLPIWQIQIIPGNFRRVFDGLVTRVMNKKKDRIIKLFSVITVLSNLVRMVIAILYEPLKITDIGIKQTIITSCVY